jgi:hypothetical protein
VVGEVYDVGTAVGSFLLSVGAAEPIPDHEDLDETARGMSPSYRMRHHAADSSRRRRRTS